MPGGELAVPAPSEWLVSLIPDILARMALIASKKGGYFCVMLVAVAFGVRALRRIETPLDRLAVIAGVAFLAYNAFLLFTYVTVFGEGDALRAGSYWRYNMHLGGFASAFAALGLAMAWRRWVRPRPGARRALALAAAAAIVALPIAASGKLRFDIRAPKLHVRAVAERMAPLLKPDDRLVLVDASPDGTYAMIVRYALRGAAPIREMVLSPEGVTEARVRLAIARNDPTHVWVHVPTPAVEKALGLALAAGAAHLVARDGDRWREVASWPYPGYALPSDVPD
jgi:hypothetical protein